MKIFDIAINQGEVVDYYDGVYEANLGIEDGVIQKISKKELKADKIIDAKGMIVSPGFVDIHMHEDKIMNDKINIQIFNSMVLMGVTTAVGGNCGLGSNDIKRYYKALREEKSPVNYLGLVGHASLREAVSCNDRYKAASNIEIDEMRTILKKQLDGGALGLSFGLEYTPGAKIQELIKLSEVVSEFSNKFVTVHYRFDAKRSLESIGELIIVSRDTPVKMQISHLGSCIGFGQTDCGLKMLEAAKDADIDIMADAYPYNSFSTYIGSAVFDEGCFKRWNEDYSAIKVCNGKYKGYRCNKKIFDYLRKNEPETLVIAFVMNEEEIIKIIKHPLVMISSDGLIEDGYGHPRAAGTFPKVLGDYVRDKKELGLTEAIGKMTALPAERIGLNKRGRIKEGYKADITIFDFNKIKDNSTYDNPLDPPSGIKHVLVSGVEVVKDGLLIDKRPGKILV